MNVAEHLDDAGLRKHLRARLRRAGNARDRSSRRATARTRYGRRDRRWETTPTIPSSLPPRAARIVRPSAPPTPSSPPRRLGRDVVEKDHHVSRFGQRLRARAHGAPIVGRRPRSRRVRGCQRDLARHAAASHVPRLSAAPASRQGQRRRRHAERRDHHTRDQQDDTSWLLCGPIQGPARPRARESLWIERHHTIHHDVLDAGRILVRPLVGGIVLHRGWIKHDEVGQVAIANQPAIADAHLRGRRAGHALHRCPGSTSAFRHARTCPARAGTSRTIAGAGTRATECLRHAAPTSPCRW